MKGRRGRNGQIVGARGGIITRGWADPQNHGSLTSSEPRVPGELYELTFELQLRQQRLERDGRLKELALGMKSFASPAKNSVNGKGRKALA